MRYIFSGVEAATLAWEPLGWEAIAFAEIEPFPSAVLAHHWPDVPNLGDITQVDWSAYRGSVDLLVGGSPCQSFSVAGLRKGLSDPRGNLALEYLRAVDQVRPTWVVWENVPGVLSSSGGRDFSTFLGALAELGYGFCYRVLDAQYFGVPQRRRRVFVVGHLGDWQRAAAVLLERESLRRDPPPCREARPGTAGAAEDGPGGRLLADSGVVRGLKARFGTSGSDLDDAEAGHLVPALVMASGQSNAELGDDMSPAVAARQYKDPPILFKVRGDAVRRLTPRECERLQGMPDDHTRIPWRGKPADECPDGPRYKAIGNSMAVPVMRWIGERLQEVSGR